MEQISCKRPSPSTEPTDQIVEEGKVQKVKLKKEATKIQGLSSFGNENDNPFQMTLNAIPVSSQMLQESCLPLGIIVKPFAPLPAGQPQGNVRPFGFDGPKCEKCTAFLTTSMCPVCRFKNIDSIHGLQEIKNLGYEPVQFYESEQLLDTEERSQPTFVFVIEMSRHSFKSGQNKLLENRIMQVLDFLPTDCCIGFMTYRNDKITYINFIYEDSEGEMCPNPDEDEVESKASLLFVPRNVITMPELSSVFEGLQLTTTESDEDPANLQTVIAAGFQALVMANRMGKLIVLHSSDVTSFRESKTFQTLFMNAGISIDFFLFNGNENLDLNVVCQLSDITGGQVYRYSNAKDPGNEEKFMCDMEANLSRAICFESKFQIIVTPGIKVTKVYATPDETVFNASMGLGIVDVNRALAVEFAIDDSVPVDNTESFINMQTIFTYTTLTGERKIRISNYEISTCDNWTKLYGKCNPDAILTFLIKQNLGNESCGSIVLQRMTKILKQWQNKGGNDDLMWKNLALYTNCFLRTLEATMTDKDRLVFISSTMTFGVAETIQHFYPKLYPLSGPKQITETESDSQICTKKNTENLGAFMIGNGFNLYFCINDTGSKEMNGWLLNVFGTMNLSTITTDSIHEKLSKPNSDASNNLRRIIQNVNKTSIRFRKLIVLKRGLEMDEILDGLFIRDQDYVLPGLEEPPQTIQLPQDVEMPPHKQVLPTNYSPPKETPWFASGIKAYYTTILKQSKAPWTDEEKAYVLKLAAMHDLEVGASKEIVVEERKALSNEEDNANEEFMDTATEEETELAEICLSPCMEQMEQDVELLKSISSLPINLCLKQISGIVQGVFTKPGESIPAGEILGPIEGPFTEASPEDIGLMNAIYPTFVKKSPTNKLLQLDRSDDSSCNWTKFVRNAMSSKQRNVFILKENDEFYFCTCTSIPENTEIMAGNSPSYAIEFDLPFFQISVNQENALLENLRKLKVHFLKQ